MVGADHIQPLAEQGQAQGVAVGAGLDRRVAFDLVARR